jgi:N-acylneuraminate cytidylyltransferase/CMP-N,N'-diacetyllegionaminic acid synthase
MERVVKQTTRRVCTILARGGSKGLPGKNVRMLVGKPLIAHAIDQAKAAGLFDSIAVSSDDASALAIAEQWGVELAVRRPDELATDGASKLTGIRHAVLEAERRTGASFATIVDIDVTCPLRTVADIRGAVELFERSGVTNVITGAPAHRNPYFNLVERRPDGSVGLSKPTVPRIERRQDAPDCFDMNAAIYVWKRDVFMDHADVFYPDTQIYEMPEERSRDIDSLLDFDFVEFIMTRTK